MGDKSKDMSVDMPENGEMKNDAIKEVYSYIEYITELLYKKAKIAVEAYKLEAKISEHLKKYFDKKYGPNWHCVVGMIKLIDFLPY